MPRSSDGSYLRNTVVHSWYRVVLGTQLWSVGCFFGFAPNTRSNPVRAALSCSACSRPTTRQGDKFGSFHRKHSPSGTQRRRRHRSAPSAGNTGTERATPRSVDSQHRSIMRCARRRRRKKHRMVSRKGRSRGEATDEEKKKHFASDCGSRIAQCCAQSTILQTVRQS